METTAMNCECLNWARSDAAYFFTSHHKNCPNYDGEREISEAVHALLGDIERWANGEDGIPEEAYANYARVKFIFGYKEKGK